MPAVPTIDLTPEEIVTLGQWARADRQYDDGDATVQGIWAKVMEAAGAASDANRSQRCLITGCRGVPEARGLCHCCYAAARKRVRRGETTWEILEAEGKAKPAMPGGMDRREANREQRLQRAKVPP